MSDVVIRVERLGKKYRLGANLERYKTLRDSLASVAGAPIRAAAGLMNRDWPHGGSSPDFWALRDVSFEVRRGEVLGVIGRNGAGKSTLLKLLSQISEPTEGQIKIKGRIASLLEVGTGFHPELTGRENVFLSGAILGMSRAEITRKFDDIVTFAEVEKFIDTPVKHLSSGMYLRLAFAVAAHLEPDILLVDEVLAVGDAAFQKKCLGKMESVAHAGRTVLFVSHNMGAITQLCGRSLWLDMGALKLEGASGDVVDAYLRTAASGTTWQGSTAEDTGFGVQSAGVLTKGNDPTGVVRFDDPFKIEIAYTVSQPVRDLAIIVRLSDGRGNAIWTSWDTDTTCWNGRVRESGQYRSTCTVPGGILRPGVYYVSVGAHVNNVRALAYHESILSLEVSSVGYPLNSDRIGIVSPLLDWDVERLDGKV